MVEISNMRAEALGEEASGLRLHVASDALKFLDEHKETRPFLRIDIDYARGCSCCGGDYQPYVRAKAVGSLSRPSDFKIVQNKEGVRIHILSKLFDPLQRQEADLKITTRKVWLHGKLVERLTVHGVSREQLLELEGDRTTTLDERKG